MTTATDDLSRAFGNLSVDEPVSSQDIEFFEKKGIELVYHFTDISNVRSIKQHGLFSTMEQRRRKMSVRSGGNRLSRDLDSRRHLDDYVRFSIVPVHPMLLNCIEDRRIPNPVILAFPIKELLAGNDVKFCAVNATKTNAKVCKTAKEAFDFLKLKALVNMSRTPFAIAEEDRKYLQAEILIKKVVKVKPVKEMDVLDLTLSFGKYQGHTFRTILFKHFSYFRWMLLNNYRVKR